MSRTRTADVNHDNAKVYSQIQITINKDVAAKFRETITANGDTISGVLGKAINEYITQNTDTGNRDEWLNFIRECATIDDEPIQQFDRVESLRTVEETKKLELRFSDGDAT